jgi:hypothetical protein
MMGAEMAAKKKETVDPVTADMDAVMAFIRSKDSYRRAEKSDTRIYLRMIKDEIDMELDALGNDEADDE